MGAPSSHNLSKQHHKSSMDRNDNNNNVINLIDDDDEEDQEPAAVHPYERMVPAFNPAVYTFLRDDLLSYTVGHKIHFVVRGRPVVQGRPRYFNNHVVNPTATRVAELQRACRGAIERAGVTGATMFLESDHISVTLVFRMPRPLNDFAGRNRLTGARIDHNVFSSALGDVDNFAKLVMDGMNGVLFVDDRQVVILKVVKTVDDTGMSNGSTEILVRKVRSRDMRLALANIV
mmetsp:Transcript_25057/g.41582  ORF Transcript_25057/g.41582 Transcript_25057/m.41582 type:complete len:232 (+) Transcript_25057:124-819(+)